MPSYIKPEKSRHYINSKDQIKEHKRPDCLAYPEYAEALVLPPGTIEEEYNKLRVLASKLNKRHGLT